MIWFVDPAKELRVSRARGAVLRNAALIAGFHVTTEFAFIEIQ